MEEVDDAADVFGERDQVCSVPLFLMWRLIKFHARFLDIHKPNIDAEQSTDARGLQYGHVVDDESLTHTR